MNNNIIASEFLHVIVCRPILAHAKIVKDFAVISTHTHSDGFVMSANAALQFEKFFELTAVVGDGSSQTQCASFSDAVQTLVSKNAGTIYVFLDSQLLFSHIDVSTIKYVYVIRDCCKNEVKIESLFDESEFEISAISKSMKYVCEEEEKSENDIITYDVCIYTNKRYTHTCDMRIQTFERLSHTHTHTNNIYTQNVTYFPSLIHKGNAEIQYLESCADIINNGGYQPDRTGVGVLAVWGKLMRYDLTNSFPLLTTKRVFWRGIAEELLWFLRGDTNGNHLLEKNVKIWVANGTREFLDMYGLQHREVGDLGPVYGFQWRHFGAEYKDMHADYTNQGVDQLMNCLNDIKNNPTSRRIIMSAWNPTDLKKMALPPCHLLSQFFVMDNKLSCLMYQRSADMGLGVPFNIASYALLTHIMAHFANLQVGEFIHVIGHAHVYVNHIDAIKEQLKRIPRPMPRLCIKTDAQKIEDLKFEDFVLSGYHPYPTIKMEMAA